MDWRSWRRVDGEIIVLDEDTRPNFQLLQRRLSIPRPKATLQRRLPARLLVFDVPHLDGRDLTGLPYRERRDILETLTLDQLAPELATSPAWFGVDGNDVLQAMVAGGMEGVVCKAVGFSYQVGGRSRQWIKTPYRRSSQFVVGGALRSASALDVSCAHSCHGSAGVRRRSGPV